MRTTIGTVTAILAGIVLSSQTASAWHVSGRVACPTGVSAAGIEVCAVGVVESGKYTNCAVTGPDGFYYMPLLDSSGEYVVSVNEATLPLDTILVSDNDIPVVLDDTVLWVEDLDFLMDGPFCDDGACWFTGGGTEYDRLLGIPSATKGNKNNFGGVVHPGCSPTAADGGNWNHISRELKLHFKGKVVETVDCGNVAPPHPPGSDSPKTPFNYLECWGSGTLKGVMGNKVSYDDCTWFARFEDRNEPGAKQGNAGSGIDRYFLIVKDSGGTTRLLIDEDGIDDSNVDPTEISTGNFQIHTSSCDDPPF